MTDTACLDACTTRAGVAPRRTSGGVESSAGRLAPSIVTRPPSTAHGGRTPSMRGRVPAAAEALIVPGPAVSGRTVPEPAPSHGAGGYASSSSTFQ